MRTTFWQLIFGIIITSLVALVIGLFFTSDKSAFLLGVLFGSLVSVFLLKHMSYTIEKSLTMPPKIAEKYSVKNYFFRYFINLVVLVIAVLWDYVSIIGVFIGLFSIKISAFVFPYISNIMVKRKNRTINEDVQKGES